MKQNGRVLRYADPSLTRDKDVVLEAVKQDGRFLKYADASLTRDKEVVLEAVKQNGWALQFADAFLKRDKEVVLEAMKQCGWTLEYADASLHRDKEIITVSLKWMVNEQTEHVYYFLKHSNIAGALDVCKSDEELMTMLVYADGQFMDDIQDDATRARIEQRIALEEKKAAIRTQAESIMKEKDQLIEETSKLLASYEERRTENTKKRKAVEDACNAHVKRCRETMSGLVTA